MDDCLRIRSTVVSDIINMAKNNRTLILYRHRFRSKRQSKIRKAFDLRLDLQHYQLDSGSFYCMHFVSTLKFKSLCTAVAFTVLAKGKDATYTTHTYNMQTLIFIVTVIK